MKKLLLLILFIAAVGVSQKVSAQNLEENCVLSATVVDKDPNGLNVRSKPAVTGKILTTLKHNNDGNFIVYVTGYSNGWLKIGGANDGKVDVSKTEGWVSAKMVSITAGDETEGTANLYQKVDAGGKVLAKIPAGTALQIVGLSCFEVKVIYQGQTGWVRALKQ